MLKEKSVFIFVLGIIIFSATIVLNAVPSTHHPRNSEPHTINIVETSSNWEMVWRRPNVYLVGQPVTTDDTLCYTAFRQEEIRMFGTTGFLVCLDLHSGIEKWTARRSRGEEIASDHNQVYARVSNTSFVAYNADNGQQVWQQSIKARIISNIVAYDGFVKAKVVVGGELNVYHVFDAVTGTHQDNNDVPSMSYSSFASDGQRRFHQPSYYKISSPSYWETSFYGQILLRPVLNGGRVFVRTDHIVGPIYALDAATGHTLWEKEDVVSNVAVSNSIAFYVTIDGEVMAVDVQTGETTGRLKLDTDKLIARDMDTNERFRYYVEAVDDMVFVYFGDTWQLFAFRFSQE